MMRHFPKIFCLFSCLWMASCGHPSFESVFNTSTEAYPVANEAAAAALEELGEDSTGLATTSVVRIQMQGIADSKMESVWLQALVLKANEGDLRFIESAKLYLQAGASGEKPVFVGSAKASELAADGKSLPFKIETDKDLASILRGRVRILIEIQGGAPVGKANVSADLRLKARIVI